MSKQTRQISKITSSTLNHNKQKTFSISNNKPVKRTNSIAICHAQLNPKYIKKQRNNEIFRYSQYLKAMNPKKDIKNKQIKQQRRPLTSSQKLVVGMLTTTNDFSRNTNLNISRIDTKSVCDIAHPECDISRRGYIRNKLGGFYYC